MYVLHLSMYDTSLSDRFRLLKHTVENQIFPVQKVGSNEWLKNYSRNKNTSRPFAASKVPERDRSSGKTIPFTPQQFKLLSELFHIHGSIARTIRRADVSIISRTRSTVNTEGKQYEAWSMSYLPRSLVFYTSEQKILTTHRGSVYHVRTSNAWKADHAVTITYFPHNGLTFGVVFGCDAATEADIIKRLQLADRDALHPLLVPGIMIELERQQHVIVAKDAISDLETLIFQLNPRPDTTEIVPVEAMERRHREKREKWLNMNYLRNCLISWNHQLASIKLYLAEIEARQLRSSGRASNVARPRNNSSRRLSDVYDNDTSRRGSRVGCAHRTHSELRGSDSESDFEEIFVYPVAPSLSASESSPSLARQHQIYETGFKIRSRIQGLLREYDDLIRDCSMRIDGMSMATQWVSLHCPWQLGTSSVPQLRIFTGQRWLTGLLLNRHKERPTWKSQRQRVGTRST